MLLAVVVHPADIQDLDGAKLVIDKLRGRFPRLRLIWADAGYAGQLVDWVQAYAGYALEIVKRPRASHHFEGTAPEVGGRTNAGVAGTMSSVEQGL